MKKCVYIIAFIMLYGQVCASELKTRLECIDAWYDPVPAIDASLDEDKVMNNFWRSMKDKSQKEKDEAFQQYAISGYNDCTRHIKRYQMAAGAYIGANVNIIPRYGESALTQAVFFNDYPLAELLLNYKADPNIRDLLDTPLFYAKNVEMAELLVAKDASVQKQDNIKSNLLHYVIRHHYQFGLISYYCLQGVRYDAQDMYGDTPLDQLTRIWDDKDFSFQDYAKAFLESGVPQEELLAAFEKMRAQGSHKDLTKNYRTFIEMVGAEKAIGPVPDTDTDSCYAEQLTKAFYAMSK